jgi:heterodisulfide reductase subunit D
MTNPFKIGERLYTAIHKCTRCGQCTYSKEEAEFQLLCPMQMKGKFFTYSAGGMIQLARALYEGKLDLSESIRDLLYLCTTCGACEVNCGVIEDQVDLFTLIKKELINNGVPLFKAHGVLTDNVIKNKSPYSKKMPQRIDWMPEEKKGVISSKPEIFYYVGCVSSFMETEIPNAFIRVLEKLGIPFTLDQEEWCCGAPLYFAGYEEKAFDIAKHNVEAITNSGAPAVIFTCPTCSMMFNKYYPRWLKKALPFEAIHVTEFLDRLLEQDILKLEAVRKEKTVTYHDPCHLGRGQGIYEAPRKLINAIEGLTFKEMVLSEENSLCCGGGGLLPTGYAELSENIAKKRIGEMQELGADLLVSACPACKENIKIAVKGLKRGIKAVDIVELIDMTLA